MRCVHRCVSLFPRSSNFHYTHTRFFFLRQVYLSRSQGGREIIKFFEYFSSRALCKIFQIFQIFSLLPFTSNLSKIEMYRNLYIYIYMYVFTVDQAILRERLGRGGFICNNVQATRF